MFCQLVSVSVIGSKVAQVILSFSALEFDLICDFLVGTATEDPCAECCQEVLFRSGQAAGCSACSVTHTGYSDQRNLVAAIDQLGAAALYSVGQDFFKVSKEEYRLRRDTVVNCLRQIPGVVVEGPMGAFYVMAALPVDDSDKFQRWLLEEFEDNGDTVMFAPGAPFYETPGKGINEVRIAYVRNVPELGRAMELLAKGIARYQQEQMGNA